MQKIRLDADFIQYMFEPESKKKCGQNCYAIISNNQALLLDTGYEQHIREIIYDLKQTGISIEGIIASHYHPDHIRGALELSGIPIIASSLYSEALGRYFDDLAHEKLIPTTPVCDSRSLHFGLHNIEIQTWPGHSACTLLTNIDDKYIHTADELIYRNDGGSILPFAPLAANRRHVESLSRLRLRLDKCKVICGHGVAPQNQSELKRDIQLRINYLDRIHSTKGKIKYEDSVDDVSYFDCEHWHKFNCQ